MIVTFAQLQLLIILIDARKGFGLFEGDSILYLTNFDDLAAQGRSVKLKTAQNGDQQKKQCKRISA